MRPRSSRVASIELGKNKPTTERRIEAMNMQTISHDAEMEYLRAPLKVSRIALGTWAIGGWMWGGSDEAESIKTIHAALDRGINLIDTAPVYGFGRSEEIVGRALAQDGRRKQAVIATKVGLAWQDGKPYRNASRSRIASGGRGFIAPFANGRDRHLPSPLAGPQHRDRGNRGSDGGALSCRQNPRDRREQLQSGTDGCISRRGSAAHLATAVQFVRARHRGFGAAVFPRQRHYHAGLWIALPRTAFRAHECRHTLHRRRSAPQRSQIPIVALSPVRHRGRSARSLRAGELQQARHPLGIALVARSPGRGRRTVGRTTSRSACARCDVMGWRIDAGAMAEIDRILETSITEPVGPEFMAPPARNAASGARSGQIGKVGR